MLPDNRVGSGVKSGSLAVRLGLWLVAVTLALRWVLLPVAGYLLATTVTMPDSWEREWRGQVRVVPDMEAIVAPISGTVVFLVQDGQWVSAGSIIAEVMHSVKGSYLLYAPFGGLVSLRADEDQPGTVRGRYRQPYDGDELEAGVEVARIIRPGMICLELHCLPFDPLPGEAVDLQVAEVQGGAKMMDWFRVIDIQTEGRYLYLQFTDFPWRWLEKRKLSIILKAKGPEGCPLPKRSVVTRAGELGVLLAHHGRIEFRNIEVVDAMGRQVMIKGLQRGERVILWPKLVPHGLVLDSRPQS